MRSLLVVVPVLATAAACSPRAVTPPARTFALDSANAPQTGHSDVQMGVSRVGTIWGPELVNGETRVRHAVQPGVVLEADAGLLHVTNDGDGGNRNALTGRLGVMLRPPEWETHDLRVALNLGLGGGHAPEAGNWGALDVGVLLAGSHRWVRPLVGAGGGFSRPFGEKTFVVTEHDEDRTQTTLQLPRNLTANVSAGVELGPTHRTVIIGATMTHFWLQESSIVGEMLEDADENDDLFFALGAAARFSLD
jgi:hypothetical protein